jgi:hypothetical protein
LQHILSHDKETIYCKEARMTQPSYQDAVQILRDRMGLRWEGNESDGRAEMMRYLKQHGPYSDGEAEQLVDAMVEAGELRYQRASAAPPAETAIAAAAPAANGTGSAGTGLPAAVPAMGYWQIGSEEEFVEPGRRGQVKPRGL